MNRTITLIALFAFPLTIMFSQDSTKYFEYELSGSILYDYANMRYDHAYIGGTGERHNLTIQPTIGHFLTNNIEIIFDLRYTLSYIKVSNLPMKYWIHQLGFNIGACYNVRVNSSFSVLIGSKIGLNWLRDIFKIESQSSTSSNIYDSGWSNRQLLFPIIILGSRVVITKECSFLTLLEYSNNSSDNTINPGLRNTERISFGFGLSVFL